MQTPTTENIASPVIHQKSRTADCNSVAELDGWFSVAGDLDDFLFYGEAAKPHSER